MMSAAESTSSPLDHTLAVTFFSSYSATEKREDTLSLRTLANRIKTTTGPEKKRLPWVKLARFGNKRTEKGSFRFDENVLAVTGIEGDYDDEITSVDEAVSILRAANVAAMVYTSPSHTEDTPRWRVLCPLSRECEVAERPALVARLNGIFFGALAGESFTLSQSYYFGAINRNPSHRVELVEGAYLDERPDLDDAAIGKPKYEYKPSDAPPAERPQHTDKFIEAVIRAALDRVRGAQDGQKHHVLRAQARVLGGFQHLGKYTTADAVEWLVKELPSTAKDLKAARKTAAWGLERGATQPLSIPPLPPRPTPEPPQPHPDDPGYDLGNVHFLHEAEPVMETVAPDVTALPLVYFNDIQPVLDARDFVEGVLVEQSAAVVYGESNAGKTFWTTDLALHVAGGMAWNGRHVEQGGVVYCVLEGGTGFRNRVAAWRTKYGLDNHPLPFAAIPESINLLDPAADTQRLIDAVEIASKAMGWPIKLIVVDTLARAFAGGNENSSEDMGALVKNMDRVRAATGACVAFVHHSGKDQAKGARGHSSLRAAVDTEIEVVASSSNEQKVATVVKQRDMAKGAQFGFTLKVVELGQNRLGKPVTTCIVTPCEATGQTGQTRDKVSGNAGLALRALNIALSKGGAFLPPTSEYPANTAAVTDNQWKAEFSQLKEGGLDTVKHAYTRAREWLLNKQIISTRNGFVWLVSRGAGE